MNARILIVIGGLWVAWPATAQNPPQEHKFFKTPWVTQNQYAATGVHLLTGTEMIIETGTVTGDMDIVPNAMRAFTGSMVAANC